MMEGKQIQKLDQLKNLKMSETISLQNKTVFKTKSQEECLLVSTRCLANLKIQKMHTDESLVLQS